MLQVLRGRKTVAQRVQQYGDAVRARLAPEFERIGVAYPPTRIILVAFKQERLLEVWVSDNDTSFTLLTAYPILGLSGRLGPKLAEGDNQVPEGLYRIESLNPNSLYHLSLRLDYPNEFDTAKARFDGRENLGTDIMIHGNTCSIGCLAMGDEASEDLFVLAAETGIQNVSVIISPVDFRLRGLPVHMSAVPRWTPELYEPIRTELAKLN